MKIRYVKKHILYPAFGLAKQSADTVYIRTDLPRHARQFILAHEEYHLTDQAKFWLWREIKANCHAAVKQPLGFIWIAWHTIFSWARLKMYAQRFMEGR